MEAGGGGKSAIISSAKVIAEILRRFNWTTVTIVVDAYRNSLFDIMAQIMQGSISALLKSKISLIKMDGVSPATDYHSLLKEINKQTRGNVSCVFVSHYLVPSGMG